MGFQPPLRLRSVHSRLWVPSPKQQPACLNFESRHGESRIREMVLHPAPGSAEERPDRWLTQTQREMPFSSAKSPFFFYVPIQYGARQTHHPVRGWEGWAEAVSSVGSDRCGCWTSGPWVRKMASCWLPSLSSHTTRDKYQLKALL